MELQGIPLVDLCFTNRPPLHLFLVEMTSQNSLMMDLFKMLPLTTGKTLVPDEKGNPKRINDAHTNIWLLDTLEYTQARMCTFKHIWRQGCLWYVVCCMLMISVLEGYVFCWGPLSLLSYSTLLLEAEWEASMCRRCWQWRPHFGGLTLFVHKS